MTFTAGTVLTAAQLNSNLRDPINFIITPPLLICRQAVATQPLTNGVWTPINMDAEDIDRDGMHSTVTNPSRATAQTAGYYDVCGIVSIASNATGARAAKLSINTVDVPGRAASGMAAGALISAPEITGTLFLNVGDFVETRGNQVSGTTLNTSINTDFQSSMTCRWVSTP
jgi:hypothetical protein